jgi:hypothetical protein
MRQAACREGRPVAQPIAHILIGEPPQGAQERNEQQGRLGLRPAALLLDLKVRAAGSDDRSGARPDDTAEAYAACGLAMSASMCKAGASQACARWYADGATGACLFTRVVIMC